MDAAIQQDWSQRLRSGDYTQGKSYLKRKGVDSDTFTHCCLGVLCEMYAETHPEAVWDDAPGYSSMFGHYGMVPDEVANWAGLDEGVAGRLASRNDSGTPFSLIANMVDAL